MARGGDQMLGLGAVELSGRHLGWDSGGGEARAPCGGDRVPFSWVGGNGTFLTCSGALFPPGFLLSLCHA